jgi:hypothetical protein
MHACRQHIDAGTRTHVRARRLQGNKVDFDFYGARVGCQPEQNNLTEISEVCIITRSRVLHDFSPDGTQTSPANVV